MRESPLDTVHASPAARRPFRRGLGIAAIAAVFMAIIGALGTDAAALPVRLSYWLAVMLAGSALGSLVTFAVRSWGRLRRNLLAEGALVAAAISLPLTAVVIVAGQLAFGVSALGVAEILVTWAVVLMVSSLMTAINYATAPTAVLPAATAAAAPAAAAPVAAVAPPAEAPPRILARLPIRLRHARLLALEAEDHYLRVYTDAGSDLILLRLVDAIAETDGIDGARCHRSWWVARAAVIAVIRDGARVGLNIASDVQVPVSRSYLPALRADGWLG
jgi:DNA-binding LytR/AlgR family response regulator